ncbi:FYVE zinc finger-domain-containing protein, partial [Lineolata rhizophorae]
MQRQQQQQQRRQGPRAAPESQTSHLPGSSMAAPIDLSSPPPPWQGSSFPGDRESGGTARHGRGFGSFGGGQTRSGDNAGGDGDNHRRGASDYGPSSADASNTAGAGGAARARHRGDDGPRQSLRGQTQGGSRRESDIVLPKWQLDSDVTRCPVCHTQFTWYFRKHHCRKCGRVVCANCSPHRITIPRQFIVHPPTPANIIDLTDDDGFFGGQFSNPALGGGEEVRVCNPCVPDPNFSPPPQQFAGMDPNHRQQGQGYWPFPEFNNNHNNDQANPNNNNDNNGLPFLPPHPGRPHNVSFNNARAFQLPPRSPGVVPHHRSTLSEAALNNYAGHSAGSPAAFEPPPDLRRNIDPSHGSFPSEQQQTGSSFPLLGRLLYGSGSNTAGDSAAAHQFPGFGPPPVPGSGNQGNAAASSSNTPTPPPPPGVPNYHDMFQPQFGPTPGPQRRPGLLPQAPSPRQHQPHAPAAAPPQFPQHHHRPHAASLSHQQHQQH